MTEVATSDTLVAQDTARPPRWTSVFVAAPYLLILLLVVVAMVIFRWGPSLLWAYNIERAGRLMDAGLAWPEPRRGDSLPQLRDPRALAGALDYLDAAIRWRPSDPYAHRLVGQVYAGLQKWPEAAAAFERARSLDPENPLPAWESALAYEQIWRAMQAAPVGAPSEGSDRASCRNEAPQACYDSMQQAWRAAGVDPGQFITRGDQAWRQRAYDAAFRWYTRATPDPAAMPFDLLFRSAIAASLGGSARAPALLAAVQERDRSFEIPTLGDAARIEGADFRWATPISPTLTYGSPLSYLTDGSFGALWWSGEALAMLSVEQPGRYLIRANLRHSQPPPVEMAIGVDGRQAQAAALGRGDNSWQTITVPITLSRGLHTINLWFLNNAVVDGKDRDAVVEWVEIREQIP